MAEKDLTKLSLEELEKQLNTTKIASSALGALLIIMTLSGVYLTYLKGFSVFTVLAIGFLPLLIININSIKKLKAEIASRTL
jgi:hypothetical protein